MENEPTSEDVDRLLSSAPDLGERLAPNPDLRVHVEVQLDSATLQLLEARAEREGRRFEDVVVDAVRAGAAAA